MSERRRTFTLAGLLLFVTLCGLFLWAGNEVGYIAILLLVLSPLPFLGYLGVMHSLLKRFATVERWLVVHMLLVVGLSVGLVGSVLFSLLLLAAAAASANQLTDWIR